jgi:hypothetical protein
MKELNGFSGCCGLDMILPVNMKSVLSSRRRSWMCMNHRIRRKAVNIAPTLEIVDR